ncbi:MAG: P1 family peptidase [Candidatus Acidiferrales bacterium]|jgi:L-aminopeptidase/D-esterase-like protein
MNRREFATAVLGATASSVLPLASHASQAGIDDPLNIDSYAGGITDVEGIRVGQFTDPRRPTGVTALIFENGATAGVDVRGSAPGTSETDLLNPVHSNHEIHGITLAGGSGFGLVAASGVGRYLEEKGIGIHFGGYLIPIVPAAIIFDLPVGDGRIRPDAEAGYQAAKAATPGKVAEGNVGVGAGATVGKAFGFNRATKTGLGTASLKVGDTGVVVAAIVTVNALGDVIDPKTGKIIAGARADDGKSFINTDAKIRGGYGVLEPVKPLTNTTIGVVATNAALDKTQLTKVAQMAHDGLARTISPIHTLYDGDTIFAVSTGKLSAKVNHGAIGAIAADILAIAVLRAVTQATAAAGLPSYRELTAK